MFYAILKQRYLFSKTSQSRSLLCLSLYSGTCSEVCCGERLSTHLIHSNSKEVFLERRNFWSISNHQSILLFMTIQIVSRFWLLEICYCEHSCTCYLHTCIIFWGYILEVKLLGYSVCILFNHWKYCQSFFQSMLYIAIHTPVSIARDFLLLHFLLLLGIVTLQVLTFWYAF